MAPEPQPGAPGDAPEDAPTQADGDWAVAPLYQVAPEPDLEHSLEEERGAVTFATPARRRGLPAAIAVAAVVGLLLFAGAAAAWLVTRPDAASSSSAHARGSQATTPHNGGRAPAAATSSSTDTTESTTGTSTTPGTSTTASNAVRTVVVPRVAELKASDAASKLRSAKLVPRILLVTSSRAEGTVLAQRPQADAKIDQGSAVQLRVAKEPAEVSVPSLVGSTAATAKDRLRALGLHWSVTTRASNESRTTVLAQSPERGVQIPRGMTIRLTISSGPAQVPVPDVTALDEASARARLSDAGFDVAAVDQPTTDPSQDGRVVDQMPAGSSNAPKGSTVTITVARLN